uniref:N-acetylmuramoyl-L-alanine amidase n=1 Tax=Stomoxys calcitrans TaxID=35570 RepID=A0A1I8NTG3_STOCA
MLRSLRQVANKSLAAVAFVLLCCSVGLTEAQENAQLQIPPSLVECYNTSYFMNRDNRLPYNLETLITLIEKVENSFGFDQDITQLSIALLHRFRQDGIQRAPGVTAAPGVLPYSPTGFQFPKFRILLSRLIPGNALRFPNSTLTREERCSLHFMLSSSFDTQVRGDENQVCNNLSQYRAQRLPRAVGLPQQRRSNFVGDVEILDDMQTRAGKKTAPGAQQRVNPVSFDYYDDVGYGYTGSDSNTISQCPVENGVIRTKWGNVAAGNLIAGIAAGLQPQTVQLRSLLALSSRRPGYSQNMPQVATVSVDNRYAATLAGDLAEVALVQVPMSSTGQATVGASGAWNSTVMPKWYFLSQRQNMEMTDAEIRGGLDGLIIALNIGTWRQQASNLKLSQLLRMYYSLDGVLNSGIMACSRAYYFQQNIQPTTLNVQASAFAQVLDREMQLRVTLSPDAIANFAASAASALGAYLPNMNDISCTVSGALPQDASLLITPMTNIYVFLDTTWPYYQVVDYVNYVLENLNINPYASSVTLLAAQDGSVMVNTTNYISDIFEGWNVTTHATFVQGFNLPNVLRTVQNFTYSYMNGQQANSTVGGLSLVALLIPYMSTVSATDSSYATTQLQYIGEQIPDLRFIYYAGGTVSRFSAFVQDPTQDLFPLSVGTNAATAGGPVVMRIKKIPRQIVNPRCGAAWYTSTWGTDQMAQYARPGVINFYRMVPNYFYGANSGRYLNIQSQYSSVTYTVCTSRSVVLPQQNSSSSSNSSGDQTCVQLQGNTFSYDLSAACSGYNTIHECPPLYVSVQAPTTVTQVTPCTDAACQTPDQMRYIVSVVNLGCFNGVAGLTASFLTILLALIAAHQLV